MRFFDFENEARSRSASRENSFESEEAKESAEKGETEQDKSEKCDSQEQQEASKGKSESENNVVKGQVMTNQDEVDVNQSNKNEGDNESKGPVSQETMGSMKTKPESPKYLEDLDKFKKRRQEEFPDAECSISKPRKIPKIDLTDLENEKVRIENLKIFF